MYCNITAYILFSLFSFQGTVIQNMMLFPFPGSTLDLNTSLNKSGIPFSFHLLYAFWKEGLQFLMKTVWKYQGIIKHFYNSLELHTLPPFY